MHGSFRSRRVWQCYLECMCLSLSRFFIDGWLEHYKASGQSLEAGLLVSNFVDKLIFDRLSVMSRGENKIKYRYLKI